MFGKTMVHGSLVAVFVVYAISVVVPFTVSTAARGDTLSFTTTGAGSVTIPAAYEWIDVTV